MERYLWSLLGLQPPPEASIRTVRRLSPPRCPALKHLGCFFSLEPRTQICAHVTEGEAQTLGGEVAAAPYDQGAPLKRQKKTSPDPRTWSSLRSCEPHHDWVSPSAECVLTGWNQRPNAPDLAVYFCELDYLISCLKVQRVTQLRTYLQAQILYLFIETTNK